MIRIDVTEDLTYSQGKRSPIPDACGSEDHGGERMNPEEYYPIPPTKIQKAIICTPEEVQMWKDENLKLKTRITALEAQVAALKKIAEEERAAMFACAEDLHGIDDGHLIEARRQLAEEYPEAFK